MTTPEISPRFTVDDIHKVREQNYELRKNVSCDAYWEKVKNNAQKARQRMQDLKKSH